MITWTADKTVLTQSLLAWQGASEGDAVWSARGDVEGGEVGVVPGHGDGPTLGVHRLGGVTRPERGNIFNESLETFSRIIQKSYSNNNFPNFA